MSIIYLTIGPFYIILRQKFKYRELQYLTSVHFIYIIYGGCRYEA